MSTSLFDNEMRVTKRNGNLEVVEFDKILNRIKNVGQEVNIQINYTVLVMKVIDQLYDKISTTKIDELSAEQCAAMTSIHPDYNTLAGRISVSNHHKNTTESFYATMQMLYEYRDKHAKPSPLICKEFYDIVCEYKEEFDALCDYSRDYLIDYFGFKTLERAYLIRVNGTPVERPQHMWLRVAIGIHGKNMDRVKETYYYMSNKYFTHATPTLFNAGTPHQQLSSCYLISMESDSIDGIYNTLKDCASISKWAGGIGLHIHNVRASGSHIRGTNGLSNGIVPMLRVFNNTAKYVDQCVHPETIIYTTQGPKQICQCMPGDTHILNLSGNNEMIENVLEHYYDEALLEINTPHTISPMSITPQHPVYVLREQDAAVSHSVIHDRLEKNELHFEWVEAEHLDTLDRMVYTIPKYEKDVTSISKNDCYMLGIMLDEELTNCVLDSTIYTTCNEQVFEFMKEYFETTCTNYSVNTEKRINHISWRFNLSLPFRHADMYDENYKKRIHHRWLNLPIHKAKWILKGLLDKDNCDNNQLVFDTSSHHLMESVRYLCIRMGILPIGWRRNTNELLDPFDRNTRLSEMDAIGVNYRLLIPKTREICELMGLEYIGQQWSFMRYKDHLLSPISLIRRDNTYTGTLYDLQMKYEHNYMLHHGIVHNGGGKRNGSFAIYLEPWHADIDLFLQLRKNHGDEELKARDLFYALWIPDLFMNRVKENGKWTLMCPDECPGLSDVYGDEFVALYTQYEQNGKGRITINARDLWYQILDAQMETGTPYLLYKDAANRKSNQKNLGTIKSSNLCTEIIEYSDSNETAVCNLASIALPGFVTADKQFDFVKLHEVSKTVTYNLNRVIDINYYPTEKTKLSNMRHRPIGIGVQGLADVFIMMNMPFVCDDARELNRKIFETIYHAALEQSMELSQKEGRYETFDGSPASQGILQFDMWEVDPTNERYNWSGLKAQIVTHGLRNSLLLAPMPTASTSQILGYNECIEPITSNIYSRRTIAGEFVLTNKYLMNDLIHLGLWNEKIKNNIIANNGSIQQIETIPADIKEKYRTVWELPMRGLIDMAADRGAFICQSQSLNLWQEDPNYNSLTSMHFYAWSKGLKTGIYYLRRRAKHQAQQFTIEPEKHRGEEDEICEMCSA